MQFFDWLRKKKLRKNFETSEILSVNPVSDEFTQPFFAQKIILKRTTKTTCM
jgi:hypothetical protein